MIREEFKCDGFKFGAYNIAPESNDFQYPTIFLGGAFHSISSLTRHQMEFARIENVYWLELPGQGEADFLPSSYGFDFLAGCLSDFLSNKGIDQCNLIASSYSTPIALIFSAIHPETLSSLILAGTARRMHNRIRSSLMNGIELSHAGGEPFAHACIETLFNLNASKEIPIQRRVIPAMKTLACVLNEEDRRVFRHNTQRLLDAEMADQSIQLRPLIMTGEFDSFTTLGDSLEVAELYVDSEVVLVQKADHMMPIENPKAVWTAASHWINSRSLRSISGIKVKSEIPNAVRSEAHTNG